MARELSSRLEHSGELGKNSVRIFKHVENVVQQHHIYGLVRQSGLGVRMDGAHILQPQFISEALG